MKLRKKSVRLHMAFVMALVYSLLFFVLQWPSRFALPYRQNRVMVPILVYHKVSPDPKAGGPGLRVLPEEFSWQMEYLKTQGFTVIPLNQAIDSLVNNRRLPPHAVAITFDDGYEDNYLYAFPILQKYQFPATIFVASGEIGGTNSWDTRRGMPENRLLSWPQIFEMQKSGITFGAHTVSHSRLTRQTNEERWQEIYWSKKMLEEKLGYPVSFFAYPYGDFSNSVKKVVKRAGFRAALTMEQGWERFPADLYQLRRVRINGETTREQFIEKINQPFFSHTKKTQ